MHDRRVLPGEAINERLQSRERQAIETTHHVPRLSYGSGKWQATISKLQGSYEEKLQRLKHIGGGPRGSSFLFGLGTVRRFLDVSYTPAVLAQGWPNALATEGPVYRVCWQHVCMQRHAAPQPVQAATSIGKILMQRSPN